MTFEHAIVLDFEATCDDKTRLSPQEIIEFPSVLVHVESQKTAAEFERFVKPRAHPQLTEFCKTLTTIRQEEVDGAPEFPQVFKEHQRFLTEQTCFANNALFVTCGDWDLQRMLPAALIPFGMKAPKIYQRWANIKKLFESHYGVKGRGMLQMMRHAKLEPEGVHHRGIDDCRNIARLLIHLLKLGVPLEPTAGLSEKQLRRLG